MTLKLLHIYLIVFMLKVLRIKKQVSQTDSRVDVSSKVKQILKLFLTVRMRTRDLLVLGVTDDQVATHVAPVDGLVSAEAAVKHFRAVVVGTSLQELHDTSNA